MAQRIDNTPRVNISIAIIGAGIGGVAAAVGLDRAGFDVKLYDQAPAFAEVGGTITIDAYTIRVLQAWGIADELMSRVAPCHNIEMRTMAGELVSSGPIPDLTDIGVDVPGRTGPRELFGVQRSDLHGAILRHFPTAQTFPGMRLRSVTDKGTHAEATFDDGTTIKPRILIGADGIRSTVRKVFTDVEATPAGVTICRSLASAEHLPDGWPNDRMRRWEHQLGDGGSVNSLFAPTRQGTQVGIDTSLYLGDQLEDLENNVVPLERLLALYPDNTDPVILNALRAGLVETRSYPLFDLPVIDNWSSESITLLGDAAHAMRPLLGQGANSAIQDADELVNALVREPEVGEALQAYERVREPFTNAIKRAARNFRPQYTKLLVVPK